MVSGRAKGLLNVTKSCLLDVFYFKEINQKKLKLPRLNRFGQEFDKVETRLHSAFILRLPKGPSKIEFDYKK